MTQIPNAHGPFEIVIRLTQVEVVAPPDSDLSRKDIEISIMNRIEDTLSNQQLNRIENTWIRKYSFSVEVNEVPPEELTVLSGIVGAFVKMEAKTRVRVLRYLVDRFGVSL